MAASRSRRQVLLGAGASLAGLIAPWRAQAKPAEADALAKLLGQALPSELRALLPGEAFQVADFVTSLASLEGEAKHLRLPLSRLSLGENVLPLNLDRIYETALPRLVALIDRSSLRHTTFADKAGGLLSLLHGTQHLPPAWLSRPAQRSPSAPLLLGFDPGTDEPIGLPSGALELPDIVMTEPDTAPPVLAIKRSLRFPELVEEYTSMFRSAELRAEHRESTDWHLSMMRQSRARYEAVGKRNGVPWYFIAAIHGLEASFNFRGHLHNGDFPLSQRTRQVPAGRPQVWLPPSDWESSATDALRLMGFANASDWSLARTLYRLEAYNGFGYRRIGRVSPYLWSYSSLYERGKFVADGRFNPNARSQQCGAAVMLKLLDDAGEISLG